MVRKKSERKLIQKSSPRGRPPKSKLTYPESRVNIGVSVNDVLWRRLRALAMIQGRVTGDLLDEAIDDYLRRNE